MSTTPESAENDWQRIWFTIRQQPWTSLAVIPTETGLDVQRVADRLAAAARVQGDRGTVVINGTAVPLSDIQEAVASITTTADRGDRVIVPVDALADSPAAVAIAQATTAAVLVVRLGQTKIEPAKETLQTIGRNRFIGSIVLDDASNVVVQQ